MKEIRDTIYEHMTGSDTITVTAEERKEINRLKKLNAKYPNQVEIVCENEDGSLLAHIPYTWLVIKPPRKVPAHIADNLKSRL